MLSLTAEGDPIILTRSEVNLKLHDLVGAATGNTATRLDALKWEPKSKCRLSIPLCRMISLPVVCPYLKSNVSSLGSYFISSGYMEGNGFFYVVGVNENGQSTEVSDEIMESWSPKWRQVNAEFEKRLQGDEDLCVFSNLMFMVWDGNYRLQAWLPIIEEFHKGDISWHYSVDSIILDPKGDVPSLVTALHDVNW